MAVIVREYFQPGVPGADRVAFVDESGGEARTYLVDAPVGDVVLKVQRPQQLRTWTSLPTDVAFFGAYRQGGPELPGAACAEPRP